MDIHEILSQVLSTIYTVVIIVISSISSPEISGYVKEFLSSNVNKLILIGAVIYLAFNNFVLGIVLTMGLFLILNGEAIVNRLESSDSSTSSTQPTPATSEENIDDEKVVASILDAEIRNIPKLPKEIRSTNPMKPKKKEEKKVVEESKEIVENDNVIYEVSPNNEEVKQVKKVEEVKKEVKPEILRKKIQPNPNMQSYHFHRIESAIPLVPEENNDDKLDYSPVKQQINKLKDVTGIEANLTKSQRGFDDLSVRDTELKDLIPTQNLLNVKEPKCTANKPEECECKSIKQGGNNYSIETESVILPYNGNPLYNIENL